MGPGNLTPTGIRSPDRLALSESQYRLNYPGPTDTDTEPIISSSFSPILFFKAHFNIILCLCLRLPSGFFPSGVSNKAVYALPFSTIRATWPVPVARVTPSRASRAFFT